MGKGEGEKEKDFTGWKQSYSRKWFRAALSCDGCSSLATQCWTHSGVCLPFKSGQHLHCGFTILPFLHVRIFLGLVAN